jgi:hypothetical protein
MRAGRIVPLLAAGAALVAVTASTAGAAGSAGARSFTFYSQATAEQFVNNADDRLRGKGQNPFGNFHDNSPTTKQAKGPFPGDEALFAFAVYVDGRLAKQVGSATYACAVEFQKNVYCDVQYELPRGRLVGAGTFNFAATRFTIAITGGSGAYAGLSGRMLVTPAPRTAQRLAFALR